jgi:hypothetical protein
MTRTIKSPVLAIAGALALAAAVAPPPATAAEAEVITLTQVACQFLEPEGSDRGFETAKKADCDAINAETGMQRLDSAEVLTLAPGKYVFRVTNQDVPYELGFWVRDADYDWKNPVHKLTKTSVSGGGLTTGTTQDYEVELAPGEYLYSCPLNPTPDYRIIVEG